MGLSGDLKRLAIEYKRDPSGQYYRNLDKMLSLYKTGKTTKSEVLAHVRAWAEKE
jgi:hypothetical protein